VLSAPDFLSISGDAFGDPALPSLPNPIFVMLAPATLPNFCFKGTPEIRWFHFGFRPRNCPALPWRTN